MKFFDIRSYVICYVYIIYFGNLSTIGTYHVRLLVSVTPFVLRFRAELMVYHNVYISESGLKKAHKYVINVVLERGLLYVHGAALAVAHRIGRGAVVNGGREHQLLRLSQALDQPLGNEGIASVSAQDPCTKVDLSLGSLQDTRVFIAAFYFEQYTIVCVCCQSREVSMGKRNKVEDKPRHKGRKTVTGE